MVAGRLVVSASLEYLLLSILLHLVWASVGIQYKIINVLLLGRVLKMLLIFLRGLSLNVHLLLLR